METIKKPRVVAFGNAESLKPESLICFSPEYVEYIPYLRSEIKNNEGRIIDIILARIDKNGVVGKRVITGKVVAVSDASFSFLSNENFFDTFDFEKLSTIHFNNILGDVPLLPRDINMEPFKISDDDRFLFYYQKLLEMITLLEESVDTIHGARLSLQFDDMVTKIEGTIISVNKSNVEILQCKSDNSKGAIDIGPCRRFIKFVTPSYYVSAVSISDSEVKGNFFDDDEL